MTKPPNFDPPSPFKGPIRIIGELPRRAPSERSVSTSSPSSRPETGERHEQLQLDLGLDD